MKRVYVVGAARSGTTLVNQILLLSGHFAIYRAETLLLSVASRRYGRFGKKKHEFLDDWYRSRQFKRSGLTHEQFEAVYDRSSSYISLLTNFMDQVALSQGKECWVDSTPAHVNHIGEIIKHTPDAYIINVIRDGRDVAISQDGLGWIGSPPGIKSRVTRLSCAILAWNRALKVAEGAAIKSPGNVLNIKYEELVVDPGGAIQKISSFIGVDLVKALGDEPSKQLATLGANTLIPMKSRGISREAIGRYRGLLDAAEVSALTRAGYDALKRYGYDVDEALGFQFRAYFRDQFLWGYIKLFGQIKRVALDNGFGRWGSSRLELDEE